MAGVGLESLEEVREELAARLRDRAAGPFGLEHFAALIEDDESAVDPGGELIERHVARIRDAQEAAARERRSDHVDDRAQSGLLRLAVAKGPALPANHNVSERAVAFEEERADRIIEPEGPEDCW